MGILMRSGGGKWQPVKQISFENESDLQEMLYQSPELVIEDADVGMVLTKEVGLPGSGLTDLVGVTTEGRIVIVETKLAKNPEIRRKVIGQVLEYGAFLWKMSFEAFDTLFVQRENGHILDLLEARYKDLDRGMVEANIRKTLDSGRFDLIIAVDQINPELDKIIAFMSSRSNALQLDALEIEAYRNGTTEIVAPHRHGQIVVTPASSGPTTHEEMLKRCADDLSRRLLTLAIQTWENAGHEAQYRRVAVTLRANIGGQQLVVLRAYHTGLEVPFNEIESSKPPAQAVSVFRNTLSRLQGFDRDRYLKNPAPSTRWTEMGEDSLKGALGAAEVLIAAWRAAGESQKATASGS